MRSEPSRRIVGRSFLGIVVAAIVFVAAHAALIRAGRDTSWGAALAVAGTNGVLWFGIAPLAMLLGRRLGGGTRGLAWQATLGLICVPLFGIVQGLVGIGVGMRAEVPLLALVFYALDLNITVLVLAAVALDVYAGRLAMSRHNRRHRD